LFESGKEFSLMATASDVANQINKIVETADRAFDFATDQNYETLSGDIQTLEGLAREAFQARLDELLRPMLAKLENDVPLTTTEQDILKLVVVGEAQYYVKSENDVENWQAETKRLVKALEELQLTDLDEIDTLLKMQALCREAMRIVPDLTFYFRQKERVENFEATIAGPLDIDTRRMLTNLIKEMLSSDRM
jgi:Txe/YoeB family toxin of Txe-Axe toxin-antitoxin module